MGIIRAEGGKSGVKRERLSYCIDSRRWVVCPFDTSPPRGRNAFRDGFLRNASCAPWVHRFRTARRFWRIRILPCRCWSQRMFLFHRNQSNSFPSRKMVKVAHYRSVRWIEPACPAILILSASHAPQFSANAAPETGRSVRRS